MKKFINALWDKVITSDVLPALIGLLSILGMVAWLVALFVGAVTLILNCVGVI